MAADFCMSNPTPAFAPVAGAGAWGVRAGGWGARADGAESGARRRRRVVNKTEPSAEILDPADLIFANGSEKLKLYFMIGLPT